MLGAAHRASGTPFQPSIDASLREWLLTPRISMPEPTLRKRHGLEPRIVGSIDVAARLECRLGIARLLVDLSSWDEPDLRRR